MAEYSELSATLLLGRQLLQRAGPSRHACVRRRSVAVTLAALLTFLAVDKVLQPGHDHISHWLAFYLPVLAASFICLVAVARGPSGGTPFRVDRDGARPRRGPSF